MDRRWGYGTEQRLTDDNQDCHGVFAFKTVTVALVCDGMGSHHGGTYASNLAVRTIYDTLKDAEGAGTLQMPGTLVDAIRRANTAIYEASRRSHKLAGMGSTVAAVVTDGTTAWIAHVGDSRVYHVRNGNARQLTRDHTMVNLFVEAELLSPEDAASHPEAHVLSRALGLERQIEVDVQEPLTLEYADTFVLCTDGVHGVITEWEFGKIDWSDPQAGVWESLREVAAREGQDNATIVAMITGEFDGLGRPATPAPILEPVDDLSSASADLHFQIQLSPAGPVPEPMTASDAAIASREPMTQSGAVVQVPDDAPRESKREKRDVKKFEVEPASKTAAPAAGPTATQADVQAPLRASAAAAAEKDKKPVLKKKKRSNRGALVAAGILGLTVIIAGIGAVAVVRQLSAGHTVRQPLAIEPVAGTAPVETVAETPAPTPVAVIPTPAPTPMAPDDNFFRFVAPAETPRLPHTPTQWLRAPGGPHSKRATALAKERKCGQALDAVREGITAESSEHAATYVDAWNCFTDVDQLPFKNAVVPDKSTFGPLLAHLEGNEPVPLEWEKAAWRRPATSGLDRRLEAYSDVSVRPALSEVMIARIGEDAVAEVLARDILAEAQVGAAYARLTEPTPADIDAWARRVYVTRRAMTGPAGSMVRGKRPAYLTPIEDALRAAVKNVPLAELEDPKAKPDLPEPVRLAWLAATNADVAAPAPGKTPTPKRGGTGTVKVPTPATPTPPPNDVVVYGQGSVPSKPR